MSTRYPLTILNEFFTESEYHQHIQPVHSAVATLAEELHTPPFKTNIVMSGDLTASVNQRTRQGDFSAERIGGQVAGKTIPVTLDYGEVDVVVDMGLMTSTPGATESAMFIYLLAHELGHAVLGRQRATSGATPSCRRGEPAGMAGLYGLEAMDEWRCDHLADLVLGAYASLDVDGVRQPARYGLIVPSDLTTELGHTIDEFVYPAWPDLVWSYRTGKISLEQMWETLQTQTSQVFKFIAHTEARARSAGHLSPISQVAGNRGADLYLHPAWATMMEAAEAQPILADQDEFQSNQSELLTACRTALSEMWATLGITGRQLPDGSLYLDVTNPAW
ncbi:hypothetical protein GA0070558_15619 [Micromonospora haikouensis]|uniref:Uncharacterized protein n=1 Tax=Micromonospora haikouensis TaxID=686309 RepID=A0A1C4YMG3_9ACTN|nr:hypothetical protein [Micromonospora haikouensis]SCF21919.1 hypothetical protein GA0070558_15619 [Micromonospora haikouensis]